MVKKIGEINTVYSRDGGELQKQDIELIDDSDKAIRLLASTFKIK